MSIHSSNQRETQSIGFVHFKSPSLNSFPQSESEERSGTYVMRELDYYVLKGYVFLWRIFRYLYIFHTYSQTHHHTRADGNILEEILFPDFSSRRIDHPPQHVGMLLPKQSDPRFLHFLFGLHRIPTSLIPIRRFSVPHRHRRVGMLLPSNLILASSTFSPSFIASFPRL